MNSKANILEMISLKKLFTVFYSCIAIALIYAVCFGSLRSSNVSLAVFAIGAIVIIMKMMSSLAIKPSKEVYYLLIPITLIVISNVLFASNTILNFIVVMILIILFALCNINKSVKPIVSFNLLTQFFKSVFYANRGKNSFSSLLSKKNIIIKDTYKKVLIGIAISIPAVLIIVLLLASADAIFSKFIEEALFVILNQNIEKIFSYSITFILAFIISYITLLNFIISSNDKFENDYKKNIDNTIVSTFLVCINLVFLMFCFTQLSYVIFKDGFLKLPVYISYAEYARSGFFQLLFVSVINFSVIILIINFMKDLNEYRIVKVLLKLLVIFTLVLVMSSLYRIKMYIDAFGFTQLRLQVILFLIFNAILLVLTYIKLYNFKINIGKQITIVVLLGIIANSYICNGFVAAKLNVTLYNEGKLDRLDKDYLNPDYEAYIKYAVDNGKIKSDDYSCSEFYEPYGWQDFTLTSLLCD